MDVPIYYTLQQCDKVTVENITMPYMKSLYSCLNRMIGDGYTEDFKPTVKGLVSKGSNRVYTPDEIKIVNSFRFEGNTNPEDNVVMYIIETEDGVKGTLVNSYGAYTESLAGTLLIHETHT